MSAFNREQNAATIFGRLQPNLYEHDFRETMRYRASDGNSVTTFALKSFAPEGDSSCRTKGISSKSEGYESKKIISPFAGGARSVFEEPGVAAAGDSVQTHDFRRT